MIGLWIARTDAWSLCRHALRETFGAVPEIERTPSGKPVAAGVCFSVAHARDLVAVCVSRDREVGVDVEPLAHGARVMRMADDVLTQKEIARAPTSDDAVKLWACKEAYIKAFGARLGEVDPAHLGFRIDGRRARLESRALGRASLRVFACDDHAIAVAARGRAPFILHVSVSRF